MRGVFRLNRVVNRGSLERVGEVCQPPGVALPERLTQLSHQARTFLQEQRDNFP